MRVAIITLRPLYPRKIMSIPIENEAACVPEQIWKF
jgi:hypothetical protein